MTDQTWNISDAHIKLRCKLDCLLSRKKELDAREKDVSDRIKGIWVSFGVVATPRSSMYSSSAWNNNYIGINCCDCENIGWLLKAFRELLAEYQQKYAKSHEWYQFMDRRVLSEKIKTHEEDVRLLTLLYNRCRRSRELQAAVDEKRCLNAEIKKISTQIQDAENEMKPKCAQYFPPIDDVCPQ